MAGHRLALAFYNKAGQCHTDTRKLFHVFYLNLTRSHCSVQSKMGQFGKGVMGWLNW